MKMKSFITGGEAEIFSHYTNTEFIIYCRDILVNKSKKIKTEKLISEIELKIENQLAIGFVIELEHTNSLYIAREISFDHIIEFVLNANNPYYYSSLLNMERKAGVTHKIKTNEEFKELKNSTIKRSKNFENDYIKEYGKENHNIMISDLDLYFQGIAIIYGLNEEQMTELTESFMNEVLITK